MNLHITPEELANGIHDFPPIPLSTQRNLRWKKQIQYLKVGNKVYYQKAWIQQYLEQSTYKAKAD